MKAQSIYTSSHGKNVTRLTLIVVALLLVPLVAMQFSENVNWSVFDFVIAGVLLLGAGLTYEFGVKSMHAKKSRLIATVALLAVLALVWVELAVGLFGTPFAGN